MNYFHGLLSVKDIHIWYQWGNGLAFKECHPSRHRLPIVICWKLGVLRYKLTHCQVDVRGPPHSWRGQKIRKFVGVAKIVQVR